MVRDLDTKLQDKLYGPYGPMMQRPHGIRHKYVIPIWKSPIKCDHDVKHMMIFPYLQHTCNIYDIMMCQACETQWIKVYEQHGRY